MMFVLNIVSVGIIGFAASFASTIKLLIRLDIWLVHRVILKFSNFDFPTKNHAVVLRLMPCTLSVFVHVSLAKVLKKCWSWCVSMRAVCVAEKSLLTKCRLSAFWVCLIRLFWAAIRFFSRRITFFASSKELWENTDEDSWSVCSDISIKTAIRLRFMSLASAGGFTCEMEVLSVLMTV